MFSVVQYLMMSQTNLNLLMFVWQMCYKWGARWLSWSRHCATSRKVAGSIPDYVIGIFNWNIPSGSTIVLGLTHPVTEMRTRNISWGKGGRYVRLTTLPPSCVLQFGSLNFLEPSGLVQACNVIALPLYITNILLSSDLRYWRGCRKLWKPSSAMRILCGVHVREYCRDCWVVALTLWRLTTTIVVVPHR